MSDDEKKTAIIQFLLEQKRDSNNKCKIGQSNYTLKDVSEEEFVQELNILEKEKLIKCTAPGIHPSKDLTNWREIELQPSILTYFEDKDKETRAERREWWRNLREWVTLGIAVVALGLSIFSIYLQYHVPTP